MFGSPEKFETRNPIRGYPHDVILNKCSYVILKLSDAVHNVPKTSRTRCDNVRTTISPYEKLCVKLKFIQDTSKITFLIKSKNAFSFFFQTQYLYRLFFQVCLSLLLRAYDIILINIIRTACSIQKKHVESTYNDNAICRP